MIDKTLKFITDLLNHELEMAFGKKNEPRVVARGLLNPDGSTVSTIDNRIVVSVISLEQETTRKHFENYMNDGSQNYGKVAPPVQLNLFVLISANYDNSTDAQYLEANKMLSAIIGVFQAQPYFTQKSNGLMKSPLEKLTFEIFNVPINELSHIWSGIGAKYLPSIIYKIRMLAIREEVIRKEVQGISGLGGDTKAKI